MEEKNKSNTFYYLEVTQEAYDLLCNGCKTIEQMMCGNLEAVKQMAFNAYEKRTGTAVPDDVQHLIAECVNSITSFGWKDPVNRFSEESDTFMDIYEVLKYQQFLIGNESNSEGLPPHYNKNVPQIRIINIVESSQRRNKPLKTFVDSKTKKRRI